ncbi:NLP/P60 hydrolase [Ruegeria sp. ANG-S4]|uniref:C40 family peptidase n=1 Tax=Ruegeria sp. ANG-S4 TaxID=1577904 RepID=UPI00057C595F|nr:NlpC/P60 family protein [Ruegeria sp. ANG-S4]KIC44972.1 NLP/P60 hydrolase [Ruegeria sp. ANG-S4]
MTHKRAIRPVVDILRRPDGPRDRQLLYGDTVTVAEETNGWSRITSDKDGYSGWVSSVQLGGLSPQTHWVLAPATHAYDQPDMKSPDLVSLSLGSKIRALSEEEGFLETELGYVPRVHTVPAYTRLNDPVAVSEQFLGTPYLWGGNSRFGLDCSGLIQAGLLACGIPCPGDSDDQERDLGNPLTPGEPARRGDLIFWKGHVAWVAGDNLLLHANAYHMAVAFEAMDQAIARIKQQGDGPVTVRKRL